MESSNKYPWEWAPKWAEWAATDEDGRAYWYEEKPVQRPVQEAILWFSYTGEDLFLGYSPHADIPWDQSLEKRPLKKEL